MRFDTDGGTPLEHENQNVLIKLNTFGEEEKLSFM